MNFKIFTNYVIVTDFRSFSTEELFSKFRLKFSFPHILIFHSDFVQ